MNDLTTYRCDPVRLCRDCGFDTPHEHVDGSALVCVVCGSAVTA